jgi:tRNA dimethylallyltransferase
MRAEKQPLLVICGPTASGKTHWALELAQSCPLEIVSADSRQIYRRMDIGTAKATAAEQARVHHHLIDQIDPDEEFSVAEFVVRAQAVIKQIQQRGKLACVVGGSGLYVKALTGGLATLPGADDALRRELHQQERQERGSLHRQLERVDPVAAQRIHPHNLVRIVRALEVYRLSGRPLSQQQAEHRFGNSPYRVIQLAPEWQRADLYQRIDERACAMIKAGLIEEVEGLLRDYPPDLKAFQTLGYQQVLRYLQDDCDRERMLTEIQVATRRYAKRQLTWFRREKEIIWVDSPNKFGNVLQLVEKFILQ